MPFSEICRAICRAFAEIIVGRKYSCSETSSDGLPVRAVSEFVSWGSQACSATTLQGTVAELLPRSLLYLEMLYGQIQYLVEEGDWAQQGGEVEG